MPAVQLTRLRIQLTQIIWQFTRPAEFQKSLRDLLDTYADRTFRPGQATAPKALIPAYHAPALVLRQLDQELLPLIRENAAAALALADVLWQDAMLEPRLVAITILGHTPLTPPEDVLQRLLSWARPEEEGILLSALLDAGSLRLRREQPKRWLELITHWIDQPDPAYQKIGVQALLVLSRDRSFENLPPVFSLLGPLLQAPPAPILPDLQAAVEALAGRTPTETTYLVRQALNLSTDPATARLIRRCLPAFPPGAQATLKTALQG